MPIFQIKLAVFYTVCMSVDAGRELLAVASYTRVSELLFTAAAHYSREAYVSP